MTCKFKDENGIRCPNSTDTKYCKNHTCDYFQIDGTRCCEKIVPTFSYCEKHNQNKEEPFRNNKIKTPMFSKTILGGYI